MSDKANAERGRLLPLQVTPKGEQSPNSRGPILAIGVLLGTASGIVGVPAGLLGLRVWHVLLCAAFIIAVAQYRGSARGPIRLFGHDFLAIFFVFWGVVVEFVNSADLNYPFRPVNAIVGSLFILVYWAVRLSIAAVEDAITILKGFVAPTIPLALLAATQAGSVEVSRLVLVVAPGEGLENRIADGRLIRATGLIGHWTGLGFFFCAMLAACIILILLTAGHPRSPLIAMSVVGAVVGVFASLTLAAILTAGAILLSAAFVGKRRLGTSVGIVLGMALIWYYFRDLLAERIQQQTESRPEYVPSWIPNTIAFRYKIWYEETVPVALERPFWGWGSGLYSADRDRPYQLKWFSAESQWLAQWITAGGVSMLALALLVAGMIVMGVRLARDPLIGRKFYPFLALTAMALISSFTAPIFINRGLTIPLWALFGLVCALLCASERAEGRSRLVEVHGR